MFNKLFVVAILVMVSQGTMATSQTVLPQVDPIAKMLAAAKDQGLAVAECRGGLCRDTEDGDYVVIEDCEKDGFYAYDPSVTSESYDFDSNLVDN